MKKVIQINLNMFVVGLAIVVIVAGSIGAFAAIGYVDSKQVSYCPDTTNMEATTVSDAIDVLYENVDYTPIGTVMSFMGTTIPNKYLLCDGGVYNISDYPKLAEHIKTDFGSYNKFGGNGTTTFAVPDLRGEFLRGSGTNTHTNAATGNTEGSGVAVGVHQDATVFATNHYLNNGNSLTVYVNKDFGNKYFPLNADSLMGSTYTTAGANANSRSNVVVSSFNGTNAGTLPTSRPTNTAVNYIIKAK